MAAYVHEGMTKVSWVPTVADPSAPTVAELGAGTDITELLTKDGLNISLSQNMVDNSSLAETFDAQVVGSWGGSVTLTIKRDNDTDAGWALFTHGEIGNLVVRRGVAYDTAWTAADDVEVYPAQSGEPVPNATAANAQATATVEMAVTAQPDLHAVVAT
jgi:hypothetical protein